MPVMLIGGAALANDLERSRTPFEATRRPVTGAGRRRATGYGPG